VDLCVSAGDWLCPRCRGGCGAACDNSCCNCGPCRKKAGLGPTGQVRGACHRDGFTNAHDWLAGCAAGLDQAALDARRVAKGWGHWVARLGVVPPPAPPAPAAPAMAEPSGSEGAAAEEATPDRRGAASRSRRETTPIPPLPPPAAAAAAPRLSAAFAAAKPKPGKRGSPKDSSPKGGVSPSPAKRTRAAAPVR